MLQPIIGEDIVFGFNPYPQLSTIWADRIQIEQILMNLATNARDAMPEGGHLTMETSELNITEENRESHLNILPGQYDLLLVRDTGSGMTHEEKKKIFDPFFTTKVLRKGTGLGLATIYGIVKQHKGYIYVESEVGKGASFYVSFPIYRGDLLTETAEQSITLQSGEETLLVVEDEADIRQLIIDILKPRGYNLLVASNGSEALRMSREYTGKIQVLLTDVIMPGMSGREVADTLKKERSDIKIIYMSGYPSDAIGRHGVLESEVEFLQKPITLEKLAKKLKGVLGEKKEPA